VPPMTLYRSLDELERNDEYRRWAEREFPDFGSAKANRRDFLKVVGASLAAAGLVSCRRPDVRILPYGEQPPEVVPGLPLYYATTFVLAGRAMGVLAETHVGRPVKLEGNPHHPASRGKLDAFGQAAVLDLYDPDRSRAVVRAGERADYEKDFRPAFDKLLEKHRRDGGAGLVVLSGRTASPSVRRLRDEVRAAMPGVRFVEWEPTDPDPLPYEAEYDLTNADVILSLDADFLGWEDEGVRHKRAWADGRGGAPGDGMNRMYVVEPHLTLTGMNADHRLRARASDIDPGHAFVEAALDDVRAAGERGVVVVGRRQPAWLHAKAREWNARSGCVRYRAREVLGIDQLKSAPIETMIVLDSNPVYTLPPAFASSLEPVKGTTIHVGLYRDETGRRADWHVPLAHWLESWGDALDREALAPVQPMIDPIFGGKSELEILALLAGREPDGMAIVKETFAALAPEAGWNEHLNKGVTTVARDERPAPAPDPGEPRAKKGGFEVCFAPSSSVFDGRFANNGWLQETPDPVTKLAWDNAAVMGPATARELGADNGDMLAVTVGDRTLELPAFIVPGSAEKSIAIALGYGRKEGGSLARHAGFDAYRIHEGGIATGAAVKKTGGRHALATTQQHWTIETHEVVENAVRDRALVRSVPKDAFDADPGVIEDMSLPTPPLVNISDAPEYTGEHQWGMAIDLNRCLGCNACAVACQAENNVPVVGKDEVIRGREMAWMRIDRYFEGDPEGDVRVHNQPMLCQHCENAPCEVVCPVNAAVHDQDGLNLMVYNRCIGTRYCSNNCPYKVRRFNYLEYNKNTLYESDDPFDGDPVPNPADGLARPQAFQNPLAEMLALSKNPDVTVRMRGVMEKCTFCVQRIQAAKIERKTEAGQSKPEKVADGTLLTACQQSCPADAIVFGDINDAQSRVNRARSNPRGYAVLEHLNVRPRVTYLGRVTNPNPEAAQ